MLIHASDNPGFIFWVFLSNTWQISGAGNIVLLLLSRQHRNGPSNINKKCVCLKNHVYKVTSLSGIHLTSSLRWPQHSPLSLSIPHQEYFIMQSALGWDEGKLWVKLKAKMTIKYFFKLAEKLVSHFSIRSRVAGCWCRWLIAGDKNHL